MMTENRPVIVWGCGVVIAKGQEGAFWDDTNVLQLECCGGHTFKHVC